MARWCGYVSTLSGAREAADMGGVLSLSDQGSSRQDERAAVGCAGRRSGLRVQLFTLLNCFV